MSQHNFFELRRELEFRCRQIVKLEQEIREKDDRLAEADLNHDRARETARQFQAEKDKYEQIIKDRVKKEIEKERENSRKTIDELTILNDKLHKEKDSLSVDKRVLDEKNAEIAFLHSKLREIAETQGMGESLKDLQKDRNFNEALRIELEKANSN